MKLKVNQQDRTYDGDPEMPLMWYLRDELALTGTKFGCGAGLCGACKVHVDGKATKSCVTAMKDVAGHAGPRSKACPRTACIRGKRPGARRTSNSGGYCQWGRS